MSQPLHASAWLKHFPVPWWARSPHVQTILPTLVHTPSVPLRRERMELPDGDFIDLDWADAPDSPSRVVLIFHGLEGGSDSPYVKRLMATCLQHKLSSVVHHHRSCSGENNRLARSYHSGETQDIQHTLLHLRRLYPEAHIDAVGYSLGGNALAKYLGEQGSNSLIDRATIISAPLQLSACAKRLEGGFSTIYQRHLIKRLQQKTLEKIHHPELSEAMPVTAEQIPSLNTFHSFDHHVTAPLHGFDSVDHYYQSCSGLQFLKKVTTPTLIIHAADDPFMTDAVIPTPTDLSPHVTYELYPLGGHVGFISGGSPLRPRYFLEQRIASYLNLDRVDALTQ
ncbi:hydrolase [Rubritalea tangerina]|uniref:Hydrolase n=1 Tax=Rubritalea tangerina TaxID=430798 RepID=A0ABW4Z927_9BACT